MRWLFLKKTFQVYWHAVLSASAKTQMATSITSTLPVGTVSGTTLAMSTIGVWSSRKEPSSPLHKVSGPIVVSAMFSIFYGSNYGWGMYGIFIVNRCVKLSKNEMGWSEKITPELYIKYRCIRIASWTVLLLNSIASTCFFLDIVNKSSITDSIIHVVTKITIWTQFSCS